MFCELTAAIVASAWMPTAMVESELDTRLPTGANIYKETVSVTNTGMQNGKEQMTYNGSTFDIYPVDSSAKKLLTAGDAAKNVEVESQALCPCKG